LDDHDVEVLRIIVDTDKEWIGKGEYEEWGENKRVKDIENSEIMKK